MGIDDIKSLIENRLRDGAGLFVGFGHKDHFINGYFSYHLIPFLKDEKIAVFVELPQAAFSNLLEIVNTIKSSGIDINSHDINGINGYDLLLGSFKASSHLTEESCDELFALAGLIYSSGIDVRPFDYVPDSDDSKAEYQAAQDILYQRVPADYEQMLNATLIRTKGDNHVADYIRESLTPGAKYIVLGGPGHVQVAKSLGIEAVHIMKSDLYRGMVGFSHTNILENQRTQDVFSYIYDEKFQVQQVSWSDEDRVRSCKKFGNEFFEKGDYQNALVFYDICIRIQPDFTPPWYNKALTLKNLQRYRDGLEVVNQLLNMDPTYKKASNLKTVLTKLSFSQRAQQLFLKKDYNGALECYERVLEIDPGDQSTLYKKARLLKMTDQNEDALQTLDTLLEIDPDDAKAIQLKSDISDNYEQEHLPGFSP